MAHILAPSLRAWPRGCRLRWCLSHLDSDIRCILTRPDLNRRGLTTGRNRLAGVPPFLATAELLFEAHQGFFAALGTDRTDGRIPVDHGGRMTYAGRTLFHARAGWRVGKAWTVFLDARNLADRRYIVSTAGVLDLVRNSAATAIFLPGIGRSVTFGFEWKH